MIAACNHCLAMVGTRNNSKMRIARCMQCSGRTPYDVGSSVLLLYGSRRLAKIAQFFGGSPLLPGSNITQPGSNITTCLQGHLHPNPVHSSISCRRCQNELKHLVNHCAKRIGCWRAHDAFCRQADTAYGGRHLFEHNVR